jgi:hypothetical protein
MIKLSEQRRIKNMEAMKELNDLIQVTIIEK